MVVARNNVVTAYTQVDLDRPVELEFLHGRAVVYTHRAPEKASVNEDSAAVVALAEDSGVLMVADGMGGLPSGEQASRQAIEVIAAALLDSGAAASTTREAILAGIESANEAICALGSGAGTTLALIEIQGNSIRSYHVGDSMILVTGQRGRVKFQSIPHSPVGYAVEAGFLDENEAVHHEDRNLVSNVLGSAEMRIEMGPMIELAPRDTVIIASDGLNDNMYAEEIVDGVRTGPLLAAVRELAQRCSARMAEPVPGRPSHPDDLSIVAFRPWARGSRKGV